VPQQVAVIDRAQTEELVQLVAFRIDGCVEDAGVRFDEVGSLFADEAEQSAGGDALAERLDVLVANLFVDVGAEEAGRELGVVRLVDDVAGRGADCKVVEFDGRRYDERSS